MNVKAIPDGYHSITPYLIVDGATEAIQFYKNAFGASEVMRLPGPDGKLMHAEIQIGDSRLMLADEFPEMGANGPKTVGGVASTICLYVEDADTVFKKAIDAGGKEKRPMMDQFYGDRSGMLEDPFGHIWTVATHIEDLTDEQVSQRFDEFLSNQGG